MRWLRRWWWAIVLVLVLALRAALPEIVRRQVETRASEALHARVTVGDVDLWLLAGAVALEDVAVRALDSPTDDVPLVAWKRFAVNLRWLSLFWKTIRFSTIELDEPHVALDRLQSGEINLLALVPKSEPAAEPEQAQEASGWHFGVDYLGLHRGGVRFRDLLFPDAEPVTVALDSIEVHDVAFEPEVYGGPAEVKFVAKLDQGAVRTRARYTPRPDGMALDVTLDAENLPVHRSRVYVPDVAWSDLTGALSLALRYRLETGGRNEVSGTVSLDDLVVWTAGLDEPSLAWKRLEVGLDKVDLAAHEARVGAVKVDAAVLPVRPRGPEPLPLLAAVHAAQAAKPAAGAATTPPSTAAPPPPAEPAKPWSWSVASLVLDGATVRLLGDRPPLPIAADLDARTLAAPGAGESPVKLSLAIGDGTTVIDGRLRIEPLGFAGTVTSANVSVPEIVESVGGLPPGVLQVARLEEHLDVALGSSAPTPGDVQVSGTTAVSDFWMEANDPKAFATGAKRIAVAIDALTVPGVLAKDAPGGRPLTVALRELEVAEPYARVTRTPTGIVLPELRAGPTGSAASTTTTTLPAPPAEAPAPAPAGVQLTLAKATVAKGRVDLMDQTVKPFYWSGLAPIDVALERVTAPEPLAIGRLQARVQNGPKATIGLTGAYLPRSTLELVVKDLPLMQFNPYVTAASPYSVSRGTLFVTTKAGIEGARYDTTTWLTLSDFDLASRSGQHVVLEQLGIPLTVALALLRDWRGNIDLTIPVVVDEKGTQVAFGEIVTGALMRALVGALSSPLKLVGAVLPTGGGEAQALAPAPIRFRPGSSALDAAGREQLQQVASFLASRPALGVTLSAPASAADVRGLREQTLLERLGGPRKGVIGTIRNVGARGRIVDALAARAQGEEGALAPEDAKTLDEWVADVPPPSADALRALGTARLALVEKTLKEDYGITPQQITRAEETAGEPAEGGPSVRVELGTARR